MQHAEHDKRVIMGQVEPALTGARVVLGTCITHLNKENTEYDEKRLLFSQACSAGLLALTMTRMKGRGLGLSSSIRTSKCVLECPLRRALGCCELL